VELDRFLKVVAEIPGEVQKRPMRRSVLQRPPWSR